MGEDSASAGSHPNAIHLLRTAQQHHVTLSAMADQKASIIIGVNSVIFALVVKEAGQSVALTLLAAASGLAAMLCVLAVLPSVAPHGKAQDAPTNLLFFGGFTRMSEAEWLDWVDTTSTSDKAIQQAMARDIYQLGQVLAQKKYRWLNMGYQVFILGLLATLIAFLIEAAL